MPLGTRHSLVIHSIMWDLFFSFSASSYEPPHFLCGRIERWFRERDGILSDLLVGKMRNPSHLGPILLTQVRAEDSGVYVCRVNSSISQEAGRVQLHVYGEFVQDFLLQYITILNVWKL